MLLGPSGSGKGVLLRNMKKDYPDFFYPTSCTTREPRPREKNGDTYFFVSEEEFKSKLKNDKFLEWAVVHETFYYGTLKDPILNSINKGINVMREIDYQGWLSIKENFPNLKIVTIFIIAPTIETYRRRILKRASISDEELLHRLKSTQKELLYKDQFDYVIVNSDNHFKDTYAKFRAIINKYI